MPRRSTRFSAGLDANHDGNPLSDRVGLLGRGTLKGDYYVNFDMRISRRIRLSERMRAEVIAEAFNLFNTLNVTEYEFCLRSLGIIGPEPRVSANR